MVENLNLWISSVREHYDTLSHFLKSRPQKIKEIFNFPTPINPESHHYYTSSLWSLNTAAFCLREAWGLRMLLQFCLQGPNDRKEWALFCSSPFFLLMNLPLNLPWVISPALSFFKRSFPFLICSLLLLRGSVGYSHKSGFP